MLNEDKANCEIMYITRAMLRTILSMVNFFVELVPSLAVMLIFFSLVLKNSTFCFGGNLE